MNGNMKYVKRNKNVWTKVFSMALTLAMILGGVVVPSHVTYAATITDVAVTPSSGTVTNGNEVTVYMQAANAEAGITLEGACMVNTVDVSSTFADLTDGLYRVVYTVGENDPDRAPGTIPISCSLRDSAGNTTTISAFTDNNQLAVDAVPSDDNGGNTTGTATLTDPITADNETSVTLSGTAPSDAVGLNFTITDDSNNQVAGSDVASNGSYNITGINVSGLSDGEVTANVTFLNGAGATVGTSTDSATKSTGGDGGGDQTSPSPLILITRCSWICSTSLG